MKFIAKKTQCVHSGRIDDERVHGINTPIYTSTSYQYLDTDERFYPRYFNTPNQWALANKVCALEGAEAGLIFSSGMAAISTTCLSFLKTGDHVVFQPNLYGGTQHFATGKLNTYGIDYTIAASQRTSDIEAAILPNTRVIYIETPSNPLLAITDIAEVAELCCSRQLISIIDNTFASPVNQNPIRLGIDIVLHSATKYLGGHSDICAGVAVSSKENINHIWELAINLGGSLNAITCYLLERSIKTLALRVAQQNSNAQTLAEFLVEHPQVKCLHYPGLTSHPGHEIAKKQMTGYGGMLSFELKEKNSIEFQKKLKLIKPSMSLGGVESIICSPAITSHRHLSQEEQKKTGITDELLRLSVGIEDINDLLADLQQALI
ncbi:MAG: cystathionine beta-lyase [Candidatus Fischerbacteria bacterium RBG_13_37_8]|uniref:cysteine-S-conjugate beta-lyase n=1 Tax=Candidatus Fischerbacteria bacterium RBG_13_37_8 TaxID=1817863 RepID=A0A1F5VK85_9BACT|nr:MAG: cystathionine beta-lyase [Candidatus Fischerbacteria bacterium RBG_13_37_8]